MKIIQKIYDGISAASEWSGKTSRWLILIIIGTIFYDVFSRYIFNNPSTWSWALSYMLGACFIAIGFAYTYYHEGNPRIDIIYAKLSPKKKLVIDIFFTLFLFLPLFFFLGKLFIEDALLAYSVSERDISSSWLPLTWPFKAGMAVGFILLFLQGTVTFVKNVIALANGGKEPW